MPAAAVQPVEQAQFDRCKSDKSRHAALTGPACRPQEAISQATARTEECLTSQQYTRRIASGAELYTTQSTTAETLKTAASKIGFLASATRTVTAQASLQHMFSASALESRRYQRRHGSHRQHEVSTTFSEQQKGCSSPEITKEPF